MVGRYTESLVTSNLNSIYVAVVVVLRQDRSTKEKQSGFGGVPTIG